MRSQKKPTQCYVDESMHPSDGFVVISFVFASGRFNNTVARILLDSGLNPRHEEFKSRLRMDNNSTMRRARAALIELASVTQSIAIYVGPFNSTRTDRPRLGKDSLQALQSILIRNDISPSNLSIYFDEDIFPSVEDAARLHNIFHYLKSCRIFAREDSRYRLGIQVSDAIAHSFAQIIKEDISGKKKMIDIGENELVPLGLNLLMKLRHGLYTRPMVYNGEYYRVLSDPVILDPNNDDPIIYGQNPIVLGWGVQVAPEAPDRLRQSVERVLGRIWLGCMH
jgi:hypothetical protein